MSEAERARGRRRDTLVARGRRGDEQALGRAVPPPRGPVPRPRPPGARRSGRWPRKSCKRCSCARGGIRVASTRRAGRCARSFSRRCTAAPSTCCARVGAAPREEREALRKPGVDIDLEREVMQLTEAETVRRACDALRRRARGDRARVLRGPYLPRGRRSGLPTRGYGQEPDPSWTAAAARRAHRSGSERVTDPTSTPDASELDSLLGACSTRSIAARPGARSRRTSSATPRRAEVDEMRETAASLALASRHADVGAARSCGSASRRGQRTRPPTRRRPPASRHDEVAARRAAARWMRSRRWRWPPPSRSSCWRCRSSSLRNQLDRRTRSGPAMAAARFNRRRQGSGREAGRVANRGAVRRSRAWCSCPTAPAISKATTSTRCPPTKTYQLWAVTGSAARPTVVSAGVLGPDPQALAFHASGPVRGVRGHRRARGRRRRVAATSRSRPGAVA